MFMMWSHPEFKETSPSLAGRIQMFEILFQRVADWHSMNTRNKS
jgi:hypothetical protein